MDINLIFNLNIFIIHALPPSYLNVFLIYAFVLPIKIYDFVHD